MAKPKDRVRGFYPKSLAVFDGADWYILSSPEGSRIGMYSSTAALAWENARQRIGA